MSKLSTFSTIFRSHEAHKVSIASTATNLIYKDKLKIDLEIKYSVSSHDVNFVFNPTGEHKKKVKKKQCKMSNLEYSQARISTTYRFFHLNQLQSLQSNTATQSKTKFDNPMAYIIH